MYPELIRYGHIGSYPVLMLSGFLFGYLLARWRAGKIGFETRHVDNLSLLLLITGPLGARLVSRIFYLPDATLGSALKVWEGGGLVFYGGLIFGVASALVYCWISRISVSRVLDLFAPSAALGLAFGRIGCFLAGCCWGDICVSEANIAGLTKFQRFQVHTLASLSGPGIPIAVQFPRDSEIFRQHDRLGLVSANATASLPVHPVQLYEAVLAFLLCALLNRSFIDRQFPGEVICKLGIGYACIRFPIEFLRADNPPAYFGLTLSQVLSILIGISCGGVLFWRRQRKSGLSPQSLSENCGDPAARDFGCGYGEGSSAQALEIPATGSKD